MPFVWNRVATKQEHRSALASKLNWLWSLLNTSNVPARQGKAEHFWTEHQKGDSPIGAVLFFRLTIWLVAAPDTPHRSVIALDRHGPTIASAAQVYVAVMKTSPSI